MKLTYSLEVTWYVMHNVQYCIAWSEQIRAMWCAFCFPKESIPVPPVAPLTVLLKCLISWRERKPSLEASKLDQRLFELHPQQVHLSILEKH